MRTLAETAAALARGETSAVQLVNAALARATAGVFIELCAEEALAQAKASDLRRKTGRTLGPLDGVPVAIKDLFDVRGQRTLAGSLTRRDEPLARQDAAVVAALKAHGLIAFGRTNMSELAFSGLGLNPHFGTPVPYFANVEPRAPGGSSAGSAIAVQRGIVCAALGSDTGGSVRVPAAFNGLVGFKSSPERYPMAGVYPLAPSLDSLGPITRTVTDCVLLDAVMRGGEGVPALPLAGARFVVDAQVLEDDGLQPAVRDNFLAWVAQLEGQGARVETRPLAAVAAVRELIRKEGWLGAVEAWALHRERLQGPQGGLIDSRVSERLRKASQISPQSVATIRAARPRLIAELAAQLGEAFLLMPTVRHVAPALAPLERDDALFASTNQATNALTMIGSFLNMPGLALPSGVDGQGLPTSLQVAALHGRDDAVLGIGLALEAFQQGARSGART